MHFSVIIPVYNVEEYLSACLDSVLAAATGHDVEVICVDDGSTDGSGAKLADYAQRDTRITVVSQRNAGVGAARNAGLDRASGEWVMFVDSDDIVRDSVFATVSAIESCVADADMIGFRHTSSFDGAPLWGDESCTAEDVGIDVAFSDVLAGMGVYCFAYRRFSFRDLRFPNYPLGEDLVYVARAMACSRRCMVTRRCEYYYRPRSGSAVHAELTANRALTIVQFNLDMFKALDASGRRVGKAFLVGRADGWIESLPGVILAHRNEPGWDCVLEKWMDSMSEAATMRCLLGRQRRAAQKVAASRTVSAVRLHCLLPAWLRRRWLAFRV